MRDPTATILKSMPLTLGGSKSMVASHRLSILACRVRQQAISQAMHAPPLFVRCISGHPPRYAFFCLMGDLIGLLGD